MLQILAACKVREDSTLSSLYKEDSSPDRRREASIEDSGWVISVGFSGGSAFLIAPDLLMTNEHVRVPIGLSVSSGPALFRGEFAKDIVVKELVEVDADLDYAIYRIQWRRGYEVRGSFATQESSQMESSQTEINDDTKTVPPLPKNPFYAYLSSLDVPILNHSQSVDFIWSEIESKSKQFSTSTNEKEFIAKLLENSGIKLNMSQKELLIGQLSQHMAQSRRELLLKDTEANVETEIPPSMRIVKCLAKREDLTFGESFDTGTKVFTVGYPTDRQKANIPTISFGSVREVPPTKEKFKSWKKFDLRFDIGIIGGNSGGPILTVADNVLVGIATVSQSNKPVLMDSKVTHHLSGGPAIWQIYSVSPTLQKLFPSPSYLPQVAEFVWLKSYQVVHE